MVSAKIVSFLFTNFARARNSVDDYRCIQRVVEALRVKKRRLPAERFGLS